MSTEPCSDSQINEVFVTHLTQCVLLFSVSDLVAK